MFWGIGVSRTCCVGSTGFWWCWVVLVSVSKILMFAFCHLVISGVSCFSCLWLDLVPQVFMLASISRPGRLDLSWVSVFRVLSAGRLPSCREGAQISGVRTYLMADVAIHSPEFLRSRGGSCGYLAGVSRLWAQGTQVLAWTGRDLCPWLGWVCFLN